MLIGELSKLTGLSRHTIRYYEKEGLFALGRKHRQVNNYKDYPEEVLQKLLIIKKLKGFGFTLNEAAGLLAMIEENEASCHAIAHKVAEKVQVIDQKIAELMEIKNLLRNGMAQCLDGSTPTADRHCTMVRV